MNIVETIVTALTSMVSGSATAISDGIVGLLLETDTQGAVTGLSNSGTILLSFIGIGFGVGIMYVIFNLVVRR